MMSYDLFFSQMKMTLCGYGQVWDVSTQNNWSSIACKVTMVGHLDTVRCLQVDSEKVISGSYDMTLKVWDMHTGHCRQTLLSVHPFFVLYCIV